MLQTLIQNAGGDVSAAEQGIIYIDEVDKLGKRTNRSGTGTRDISGEGVQQVLSVAFVFCYILVLITLILEVSKITYIGIRLCIV